MSKQQRTPIYEALLNNKKKRIVSFDVPGHKQGKGSKALTEAFGETCVSLDVNSSKPLDNLTHPTSVIFEAEQLAAQAFGAKHAFLMVNGTSSAVQTMILCACKRDDKIILPRNVHKSVINALVLCGAIPVYVNPGVSKELGIPLGMAMEDVRQAIRQHPDAKAVFVNNPTYYGICSNLQAIVEEAHQANMLVLCDEAHGTHFYFGENLPKAGIHAGCDLAAVSMHKTGGSLTQSSFLLIGEQMDPGFVRQRINLTQTTSGSYLLMASLDIARQNLAMHGKEIFAQVLERACYAREEVNRLGGYRAFGKEIINHDTIYDFDETKLSIHTRTMGLAGIEVYDILRDEYGIQIEFGDLGNVLAIISVGDRNLEIERLLGALAEIKRLYPPRQITLFDHEYIDPLVEMAPQEAFYARQKPVPMETSIGAICAEFVMAYPPGIPILAPGEKITQEILTYIAYAKEKGCVLTGTKDMQLKQLYVVEVE